MVTIKDIARECGVSIATVSNVLNGRKKAGEATVQLIFETARRLGYQPNLIAKGLRENQTHQIGIIVEDLSQFSVPVIVEGIMRSLEGSGYQTSVSNLRMYSRWSDTWFNNEINV